MVWTTRGTKSIPTHGSKVFDTYTGIDPGSWLVFPPDKAASFLGLSCRVQPPKLSRQKKQTKPTNSSVSEELTEDKAST